MAPKINLAPNESIILKEACVAHGGIMAIYTDDLILTNLNLICISKGLFGNTKNIYYYPLSELKQYNGKAQAIMGKLSNGIETLELYFVNGTESFNFQAHNKKTIKRWIAEISNVVGCKADSSHNVNCEDDDEVDPNSIAGAINEVGKQFKEVGGEFLNAFGFKPKKKTKTADITNEQKVINKKCISCSAPLVGKRGCVVQCRYCDTEQTL